jgi:hypothetical protein
MSLPNSMTTGQSYSDYVRGDYDWSADEIPNWKDLEWERGDLIDEDREERAEYYIMTAESNGKTYQGTGVYSCGELITVDDVEIKSK